MSQKGVFTFTSIVQGEERATGNAEVSNNGGNLTRAFANPDGPLSVNDNGRNAQAANLKCQLHVDVVKPSIAAPTQIANAALAELVRIAASEEEDDALNPSTVKSVYVRVEFN